MVPRQFSRPGQQVLHGGGAVLLGGGCAERAQGSVQKRSYYGAVPDPHALGVAGKEPQTARGVYVLG